MRVGLLTSWRVPCGIYQYTSRLAEGFRAAGAEPVILAGRADEARSVPEESDFEVHDVAGIGLWRDDGEYHLKLDLNYTPDETSPYSLGRSLQLDVIHAQYQSMLFRSVPLGVAIERFEGVSAVTFHDNCNPADFPYRHFDLHFTHRQGVGSGRVIPFGIEERPPVVRTFGLGRTQADVIRPMCEKNGWVFEDASTHESIHGGGQAWRTHNELIEWLRGADAIVLWYPPEPMAGSSQAARTAIATRRPVFTNDTEWFSDLPSETESYTKVHSIEALERILARDFDGDRYIAKNSWRQVAELLLGYYERV